MAWFTSFTNHLNQVGWSSTYQVGWSWSSRVLSLDAVPFPNRFGWFLRPLRPWFSNSPKSWSFEWCNGTSWWGPWHDSPVREGGLGRVGALKLREYARDLLYDLGMGVWPWIPFFGLQKTLLSMGTFGHAKEYMHDFSANDKYYWWILKLRSRTF